MKQKGFFSRWKQGMKELTPAQQLHAKLVGHIGTSIGLSIVIMGFTYRLITGFTFVQLGFAIFICFIGYLQVIEAIGARQRYHTVKKVLEEAELNDIMKEMEVNKNV